MTVMGDRGSTRSGESARRPPNGLPHWVLPLSPTSPPPIPPALTATFGPTTGLWILLLAKGGGDTAVSAEPWIPRSRSHVITFPEDLTDRAEMDSAIERTRPQDPVPRWVEQGRIVTRVAVTMRTKSFFTRTKIRKLRGPDHRRIGGRRHRAGGLRSVRTHRPVRLLGVRLELAMPQPEPSTVGTGA